MSFLGAVTGERSQLLGGQDRHCWSSCGRQCGPMGWCRTASGPVSLNYLLTYLLTYSLTYLLTYVITYLLTYLLT